MIRKIPNHIRSDEITRIVYPVKSPENAHVHEGVSFSPCALFVSFSGEGKNGKLGNQKIDFKTDFSAVSGNDWMLTGQFCQKHI